MNAANTTFKSYSEKSKAKRALKGKMEENMIEGVLVQVDGKWGFYVNEDGTPAGSNNVDQDGVEVTGEQVSNETSVEDQKQASAFGAFALGQLTGNGAAQVPQSAKTETVVRAEGTGRGIEKNRPTQNGITRPSIGGLCRAVWDACDVLRANAPDNVVTAKMVKAHAETQGWNPNNASIEFYQWRKFNGITGK